MQVDIPDMRASTQKVASQQSSGNLLHHSAFAPPAFQCWVTQWKLALLDARASEFVLDQILAELAQVLGFEAESHLQLWRTIDEAIAACEQSPEISAKSEKPVRLTQ